MDPNLRVHRLDLMLTPDLCPMSDILNSPIRTLYRQSGHKIGATVFLPFVSFVGCFEVWDFFSKHLILHEQRWLHFFNLECSIDTMFLFFSWPSASWEREVGILPLNSGTIVVLFDSFSVTCTPHLSFRGLGFCFGKKKFSYLASSVLCIGYSNLVLVSKLCQF